MLVNGKGLRINVEVAGSGRPLILVHGNGEDHTIFDEAVQYLKNDYTCYAVDSRCHGASDDCDELHYEDMADDIVALIDELGLEDVIYYGFSDGGIIGVLAAAKCGKIKDMVISGTNVQPEGVAPALRALIRAMYLFSRDKKLKLMLEEPHISDETLRSVRARTLVLAGSKDLVKESETLHIGANIPGAVTRILPGEGHGSYIVHSTKAAALIDAFVKKE